VKLHGLCLNCLFSGHHLSSCPSKNGFRTCNRAHHTLLHNHHPLDLSRPHQPASAPSLEAAIHSHSHLGQKSQISLATAMVLVKDAFGTYRLGRVNFITENFRTATSFTTGQTFSPNSKHRPFSADLCITAQIANRISA